MPSFSDLQAFKSSFLSIANETALLKEQQIPQDDLPLPDTKPEVPAFLQGGGSGGAGGADEGSFDFGTLLGGLDLPGEAPPPFSSPFPEGDGLDFSSPDGGFPFDLDPPAPPPAAADDEVPLFSEAAPPPEAPPAADAVPLSEASPAAEAAPLPEKKSPEVGEALSGVSSLEDLLGLSASGGEAAAGFDLKDENFDLDSLFAQDNARPPAGRAPAPAPDPFDAFRLDGETGAGAADLEDFSLAGMDAGFPGGPAAPEKAGELKLTPEELSQLLNTLEAYPLNLRIACKELFAEEAPAPHQVNALIKLLVRGGSPQEAANLAGKILGRTIFLPRGFEKRAGGDLEEEQHRFSYVFIHKLLPLIGMGLFFVLVAASLCYLGFRFVYIPARAESLYREGYARIEAGEFKGAHERFQKALGLRRVKSWFYRYAEAFRDNRQYLAAEDKYDELLRYYPRDKKGVLDYADLEAKRLRNFAKADNLLQRNILDYVVDDKEALLALGDINLAWAELDKSRYEEARRAYAQLLERYGWEPPTVERMLRYFIRIDDLGEVLPLHAYFEASPRRRMSPAIQAELGGYLLDKRFQETRGVPDENISRIEGIRDVLLKALTADPFLPEGHYHLARYYNRYGQTIEERQALEMAVRTFDAAEETPQRMAFHIDAFRRYAQLLINAREFFSAEEQLTQGINRYEDGVSRALLSPAPEFGRLYADLGDLEYFTKDGDMETAARFYERAEQNGWAPPDLQYRLGSAYYHQRQWGPALERLFGASTAMPHNRRLLYALGNAAYMRGDYFAAQGYYNRLLDLLEQERARFPQLSPNDRPEHMELAERLMTARNNLGVTLEALADHRGDQSYRSRALGLYAESSRAWDGITRNPNSMLRSGAGDLSTPALNLATLNSRNALNPVTDYEAQIYLSIDKDVLEPSPWELLVPSDHRLSDEITFYR